jgi:hypothetical protein
MFDTIHHFSQLSSSVGANSSGIGTPLVFGATSITATNASESWLSDDNSTVAFDATGSDQGAYNSYAAISAFWSDTTNLDNLRSGDITDSSIAGSAESIGANTAANIVRGGHSVHTASGSTYGA